MSDAIRTQGLSRSFEGRPVVDGLDLTVAAGEIYGLLGPNGAGKTTTIRMLTTLLVPSAGRASICGFDVEREAAQVRRRIGYVSQEKGIRHLLTARESVEIEADLFHVPRGERRSRVEEVLEVVGLSDEAGRRVAEFSGGMLKRLDLACGLLQAPRVLILDEPTLGLDVRSRHRVWNHVEALRDQGSSVLLTTNYLDEADRLCDRLAIIDAGRELVSGTPAGLKRAVGTDALEVVTDDGDRLRDALTGRAWVRRVMPREGGLHLYVEDAATALAQVVDVAREHDVRLSQVGYQQPSLDDVFLLHTGRALAGGEGAETREDGDAEPVVLRGAPTAPHPLRGRLQETGALLRRWSLELWREKLGLVFTLLQPAVWLVLLGSALSRAMRPDTVGNADYLAFMLPGVLAFTAIGAGVSAAVPLLWDKETGYLGRLLSMPLARSSVVSSRILFQTALGAAQAVLIMAVAAVLGTRPAAGAVHTVLLLLTVALLVGTVSAAFIALAYRTSSHTVFFAVSGFVTLPLVFTSSAFVPLAVMPGWLAAVARLNPLTYAIEVLRGLVLGEWHDVGPLTGLSVLAASAVGAVVLVARMTPNRSGRGLG
ncbi:ATP-binding cassette domain-containing protein [Streptomyces pinistramenti]|uniref:ATP-binding cassette domain-containing protein n=1 Tax=Streptomyces pinistramenti TaxID=2884812 RepID=UPI001D07E873|nr:ATP-binding cassette domain-containing protein [Streptomyces pinistramenti]MCB5906195.1 ABC transporter permease [Streptomyces pinistramenti]